MGQREGNNIWWEGTGQIRCRYDLKKVKNFVDYEKERVPYFVTYDGKDDFVKEGARSAPMTMNINYKVEFTIQESF